MSPQQGWNSLYNLTYEYFVIDLIAENNRKHRTNHQHLFNCDQCFYKTKNGQDMEEHKA